MSEATPTSQPPEAKPAEFQPAEAKPDEVRPAEAQPAEAKAAEAQPAEAKAAEAQPAEAKAAEAKKTPITLTPAAIHAARTALSKRGTPNAAIRLGIKGGGCSGFSYVIEYDDEPPRTRDRTYEFDGVRVVIDKKSLIYLMGTELDFEKTLMKQGFKFRNPNEATSCSCGTSITFK
jgi:iron-sulfur cluster assembly protein